MRYFAISNCFRLVRATSTYTHRPTPSQTGLVSIGSQIVMMMSSMTALIMSEGTRPQERRSLICFKTQCSCKRAQCGNYLIGCLHHLRGRTSKTVVYACPSFVQSVSKETGQRSGGRTATATWLLWIGRHRRPNPGKSQSHQRIERYFGPSSPPGCRPASGSRRR